jgi:glycosyltransferase involved in cell wall biosynthesis
MITVALLTYNRPHFLKFAIQSVLDQTYRDFEFLIIDNGSDYETEELISQFVDDRIKVIKIQRNSRDSINIPFNQPTREFFMIMHDDDILKNEFLQEMVGCMVAENFDALGSNIEFIDEKNNSLGEYNGFKEENIFIMGSDPISEFFKGRMPPCPTVLYRKNFIESTNIKFNLKVGPAADANLWVDIIQKKGKLGVINKALYQYRLHNGQDSHRSQNIMDIELFSFWLSKSNLLSKGNFNNIFNECIRRYLDTSDNLIKEKWKQLLVLNLKRHYSLTNFILYKKYLNGSLFWKTMFKINNKLKKYGSGSKVYNS